MRSIDVIQTLRALSNDQEGIGKGRLQASKRKDQQKTKLLALREIQAPNNWNRQSENDEVAKHVCGSISVPESRQIDAGAV